MRIFNRYISEGKRREIEVREPLSRPRTGSKKPVRSERQEELKRRAAGQPAEFNNGEFDPGSERTLAARLKHASRANTTSVVEAADG